MVQLGSIIQAMLMLPTRWTGKAAATKTGFLVMMCRLDGKTHTPREFPEKKRGEINTIQSSQAFTWKNHGDRAGVIPVTSVLWIVAWQEAVEWVQEAAARLARARLHPWTASSCAPRKPLQGAGLGRGFTFLL